MSCHQRTRGMVRLGVAGVVTMCTFLPGSAGAGVNSTVLLGSADNFAVLAGQGITNTGPSTVNGDIGTSPNPSITGAGLTVNGATHAADAVAAQAQSDLTIAYDDAAGRPATEIATELGEGQELTAGVYDSATGTFEITGTLTLDAEGDPDAVFVFQTASTLITASNSVVELINGGDPCNVFWQVGSSATLGTNSTFLGTILALTTITVATGVTIEGRALARNGSVTLDSDTITRSTCTTPETTGTTLSSSDATTDTGEPVTFTATVTGDGGGTPTGTVTFLDGGSPIGSATLDAGQASITTSDLPSGAHTITAVYAGAPGFESSTSPGLSQTVAGPAQAPSSTTTAVTPTTAPGGTTATSGLARTGTSRSTAGAAAVALLLLAPGILLVRASAARRRHTFF